MLLISTFVFVIGVILAAGESPPPPREPVKPEPEPWPAPDWWDRFPRGQTCDPEHPRRLTRRELADLTK